MKTRATVPLGVMLAVGLLVATEARGRRQAPSPQAVFRTTANVVVVDTSVEVKGAAVSDLTAADFTLTDNGVVQRVETVDPRAMPIDVT